MDEVISANTKFAADLYREISGGNPDTNVFISPLSLSTVLSMTLVGARENTLAQMKKVLGVDGIEEESLHSSYQNILVSLAGTANVANRIFVQQKYEVSSQFTEVLDQSYNSQCTRLDFLDPASAEVINEWVRKETKDKIKKLFDELGEDTVMVIANAIYFKSLWGKRFDASNTTVLPFQVNEKETVPVRMMYQSSKFGLAFHEATNSDILQLPHNNGKTSMLFFLPREIDGLKQLEDSFGDKLLEEALHYMDEDKTMVWLPAFKLEEKYLMKRALSNLGMTDLFSPDRANLSGVSGCSDLHASEVVHKSFIEVNEEGTEAAAATGLVKKNKCAMFGPPPTFKADHPFLFCILDKHTRNVLFLGKLVRPKAVST